MEGSIREEIGTRSEIGSKELAVVGRCPGKDLMAQLGLEMLQLVTSYVHPFLACGFLIALTMEGKRW
jgi:hypothetical protein